MSIQAEIRNRVAEGRLTLLQPALPDIPRVRSMFASEEICRLVLGPWTDAAMEERCGALRADLDHFISGATLTVSREPYRKPKQTFLSRLDPGRDEVWVIRSRAPKPGIRVFGRFAQRDVFVALSWAWRSELDGPGSKDWRDAAVGCIAEWRRLLHPYEPLREGDLHDYATDIVLV